MKYTLLTIILLFFIGCAQTKYIEVPVENIKTEYKNNIIRDTLIKNDSIIIKNKEDTVFIEKYRYLYKIKERTDTFTRTDTITVVKTLEVVKEVNRLKKTQKWLMGIGGVAIIMCLFKLFRFLKR